MKSVMLEFRIRYRHGRVLAVPVFCFGGHLAGRDLKYIEKMNFRW